MCGIVGYVGYRPAQPILLEALKRLEYRGYDSAGISIVGSGLDTRKAKGKIADLERGLPEMPGALGIAHTRWATHGAPSDQNAHPFTDCTGSIALIHNGIIENFAPLRQRLSAAGHTFVSETDTEVLVHLIESHYAGDLEAAVRKALREIRGSYAIVVIHRNEQRLVVARNESPLVIGCGERENFVASDVPALLRFTRRVVYLEDGEMGSLGTDGLHITTLAGATVDRAVDQVQWSPEDAEKGGFAHYMLKEIFEQPRAIRETLLGRIQEPDLGLEGVPANPRRIALVGCGTAYHACMVGKVILERLTGIPAEAVLASEFRFAPLVDPDTLVVAVSQSGETIDTLAAVRHATDRGCPVVAVANVVGSTLTRQAAHVFMTRAGPEIGVAATKTFSAQLTALYLLGLSLGRRNGHLAPDMVATYLADLRRLPRLVQSVLDDHDTVRLTAEWVAPARDVFFIGRQIEFPVALEGALKLKEISYIHAEGFAAGELKHGPIALFTKETPVVAIAVRDSSYDKIVGNIKQSAARGAPVIAVAFDTDPDIDQYVDLVMKVPEVHELFAPMLVSTVLHLLAYYCAKFRGCEIDQPRNLAKSVTVE